MRKLVFAASILMLSLDANAQSPGQFKIGANIGLPVGDVADVSSFTAGVDAAYLWSVGEKFQVGPTVGFQNYFLKSDYKDAGFSDFNYIPLAASGQYSFLRRISAGTLLYYC